MKIEDIVNGICKSNKDEEEYEEAHPIVAEKRGDKLNQVGSRIYCKTRKN